MEGDGAVVGLNEVELPLICPDHRSKNLAEKVEEVLVQSEHFAKQGTTALDQTARVPLPFAAGSGLTWPKDRDLERAPWREPTPVLPSWWSRIEMDLN